jgi:TonB family protein
MREYDRAWTKRLVWLLPVAMLILTAFLLTVERLQVADRIFSVGYEGPMQLLPEITILDDTGLETEVFSEERHDMVAREVEVYSDEEPEIQDEEPLIPSESTDPTEEPVTDEFEGLDPIRSYPSHAPVPYSEDYVILKMIKPVYPPEAIEQGLEGYVLVEVFIDEKGLVQEAWVRKVRGIEAFERSTVEAVRQFVFRPVRERGAPSSFWVSFLVRFELAF